MELLLIITGVTFVFGVVLRRWWLLWVVGALAATHAAWIILTGQETSESSFAELLEFSIIFLYPPALFGAFAGIMIGRLVQMPRRKLDGCG